MVAACCRPSRWQYVIHGVCPTYRSAAVRVVVELKGCRAGERFALCGRGDRLYEDEGGVRVVPKRCGSPLCPRCSRWRGSKFVGRVQAHLRSGPHGSLHHVVLTQQVRPGEALAETALRFERRWLKFWRRCQWHGVVAGLATTHITWSMGGGWHYHRHVVIEWGIDLENVAERVQSLVGD